MAQSEFDYARGNQEGDVLVFAVGGTAPAADIRVSWDNALTRQEIMLGVEVIERVVVKSDWPL